MGIVWIRVVLIRLINSERIIMLFYLQYQNLARVLIDTEVCDEVM